MLDVRKLIMLRDIATHGTMRAAAKALGMSTSALSQHIARFEREVGAALTTPLGRGIQLTPMAQQLVEHAETILATLEKAEATVAAHRHDTAGTVRVAAFHTFALTALERVISLASTRVPGVQLEFVQLDPEDALVEVLSRRVDIAVIDEYPGFPLPPSSGLVTTLLTSEIIEVYVPNSANLGPYPRTHELAQLHWAVEPQNSDAYRWVRSICRRAGFEPVAPYESPDLAVHRNLVEAGFAAAILPSAVAHLPTPIRATRVQLPTIYDTELHRTLHTVVRRGAERDRLIEIIQGIIAEAVHARVARTPQSLPAPPEP